MASVDSITTDSNVISGCFRLPRISIPKDITEGEFGGVHFKIETCMGIIDVSSWSTVKLECRGTVSALEAGGFLRPDWCPGLPGNNKTQQTVLFGIDGPQLVLGNRAGKTMHLPFIVIKRASANKFIVDVKTTEDQARAISQAKEKYKQQRDDNKKLDELIQILKEKEEQYQRYQHSPSLFKDESIYALKKLFNFSMEQLSGKYELSEYGKTTIWVDEKSMQDILSAGARLFEAVRSAKVVVRKKELRLSIVKNGQA